MKKRVPLISLGLLALAISCGGFIEYLERVREGSIPYWAITDQPVPAGFPCEGGYKTRAEAHRDDPVHRAATPYISIGTHRETLTGTLFEYGRSPALHVDTSAPEGTWTQDATVTPGYRAWKRFNDTYIGRLYGYVDGGSGRQELNPAEPEVCVTRNRDGDIEEVYVRPMSERK